MIVIPHTAIELEKGEDMQTARGRITAARRSSQKGRILRINMKIDNHPRILIAAYAPSIAAERPPFFQHLAARLTRNTILAIDANCVPDTSLDLMCVCVEKHCFFYLY